MSVLSLTPNPSVLLRIIFRSAQDRNDVASCALRAGPKGRGELRDTDRCSDLCSIFELGEIDAW
jgi:hypothetical protein